MKRNRQSKEAGVTWQVLANHGWRPGTAGLTMALNQPVAHSLNQVHGKRRRSWSWRLQTAWRLIHSLPAQRTRSTRVDVNLRISLFWAERLCKYIQPSQFHCLGDLVVFTLAVTFILHFDNPAGTRRYYLMEQILFEPSFSTYLHTF